jgi:hypothetical protein
MSVDRNRRAFQRGRYGSSRSRYTAVTARSELTALRLAALKSCVLPDQTRNCARLAATAPECEKQGAMSPRWLRLGLCLWLVQGCAAPASGPSVVRAPGVAVSAASGTASAQPERAQTLPEDEGSAALLQAFLRLRAGTPSGAVAAPQLRWSLLCRCDPQWTAELVRTIQRPMPDSSQDADEATREAFQNEYFLQTTASEVLGCIRASEAVEPLVRVLFDPKKHALAITLARLRSRQFTAI